MSSYVIWRADAPANVSSFNTQEDALDAVRRAIKQHRPAFVEGRSLVRGPERGRWATVAEGVGLVERATSQTKRRRLRRESGAA